MEQVTESENIFNYKLGKSFIKSLYIRNLINQQEYEGTLKSLKKIYDINNLED